MHGSVTVGSCRRPSRSLTPRTRSDGIWRRGGVERGGSVGESGSRIASTDLSSEFLLFSKGVRLGEGEGEVRLGEEGELEGGGAWEVRFFSWKGIFRDEGGMRGGWRGWEGGVEVRVKVRRGVGSLR